MHAAPATHARSGDNEAPVARARREARACLPDFDVRRPLATMVGDNYTTIPRPPRADVRRVLFFARRAASGSGATRNRLAGAYRLCASTQMVSGKVTMRCDPSTISEL